jgi:glycosyltransferase involved in cell wall biosynthesis
LSKIDRRKYVVVPVGTDEQTFQYHPMQPRDPAQPFKVFFYGFMLPLHGPQYLIEAAEMLKDNPNIQFTIGGRIGDFEERIKQAQAAGARIEYRQWIPFEELPGLIEGASVNVAGPFGDTLQAKHVINGKVYQFLATGSVALLGANEDTGKFVNRVNSLVVPQGDAAAIAREIRWAYDNQALLPGIAQAGRQLYDQYFSNKVIAGILQREVIDRLPKKR